MKKTITLIAVLLAFVLSVSAQNQVGADAPQLEFVMQLKVTLGETYSCGETQHGRRTVIPITGGTFEGPNIKGTILNGGADYQLYIHIRNRGIIASGQAEEGRPSFYFRCAPQFEAPSDSKYAWLNNSLFLCAPSFSQGFQGIVLNVWRVK